MKTRRYLLKALAMLLLAGAPMGAWAAAPAADKGETYPGYIALDPPLVVNLDNPRRAQFLQIKAQFYVETATDAEQVQRHMPVLRDRMITYFGGRDPEKVRGAQERERMRGEVLDQLRQAMEETTGAPCISSLYFTGFIVQ
ncbi:flagellar basal body-associated FliL family protein [Ectothiorhodospira marina]|nr:flagellar basal body-associated FliL family protein [Ectothiorhodospira marina]